MIKLSLHNSSNNNNNNDAVVVAGTMSDPSASTQRSLWIGSAHSKGSTSSSSTVRTRSFPLTYGSLHELLSPKSRRVLQYATMDSDTSDSNDGEDDKSSGKLPSLRSIPDLSDAKACPLSHCYHEHKALNESLNTLATEDTSQSDTDDYDGFAPSYQQCQFSPIPRKERATGRDSSSSPPASASPRRQASLPRLMINTRDKSRGTIWVHAPDCESPHLELSVPLLCGPRKTVGTVAPPAPPSLGVSPRRHTRWVAPTDRSLPLPMTTNTAVVHDEPSSDPPGSHCGGNSSSHSRNGLLRSASRSSAPMSPDRRRTTTRRRASIHHNRRGTSPRRSPRRRSSSIGHGAVERCPSSPTQRVGSSRRVVEGLVVVESG